MLILTKISLGLHLLSAGAFLSAGLFFDYAVLPYLRCIPPDQATKVARTVEGAFFWVSSAALALLGLTGALLLWTGGTWVRLAAADFWRSGYGLTLGGLVAIYVLLSAGHAYYAVKLRPHLRQGLPFDAFRVAGGADAATLRATRAARLMLRFESAVMVVAVFIGGAIRFGGFVF